MLTRVKGQTFLLFSVSWQVNYWGLLCISTSFQVLCATESWTKHFFVRFQAFLFIFYLFCSFLNWNQEKNVLNAGWHANAGWLHEGVPRICLKVFQPAFGCAQHLKAGQNTQQRSLQRKKLSKFHRGLIHPVYSFCFSFYFVSVCLFVHVFIFLSVSVSACSC